MNSHKQRRWPLAADATEPAILPSLLAANPLSLGDELAALGAADAVHVDVMDGHFVPNMAFAPSVVAAIRRASSLPLDIHLMVAEPLRWAQAFAQAGADAITCHLEAMRQAQRWLTALSALQVRSGLSIRPTTPVGALHDAVGDRLAALDTLLVMGVEPGFGGQGLLPTSCARLREARTMRRECGGHFAIVLDGGVTLDNVHEVVLAGADAVVIGSDLFCHPPYRERQNAYRNVANQAVGIRSQV